jgi:hypothetical protein
MHMRDHLTDPITVLWIVWLGYWWIAALRVKQPVRTESVWSRTAHVVPLLVAAIHLLMHRPANFPGRHVVPWHGWSRHDAGLALVAIGLAFATWARACCSDATGTPP